jgi:hypothetical protein
MQQQVLEPYQKRSSWGASTNDRTVGPSMYGDSNLGWLGIMWEIMPKLCGVRDPSTDDTLTSSDQVHDL